MNRHLAYDGLRGWLLIIIACNHLYGSFVTEFTRTPLGFVSAAEGFVFLSGFVAYLVYGRLIEHPARLKQKIWRRIATIYGFHLFAIFCTFLLVWLFPFFQPIWTDFFNAGNWFISSMQSFGSAIFLLEHPGFHDILILYLVPMICLPFAIFAIKQGKAYLVGALSCLVWLLAQFISADFLSAPFNTVFSDIKLNVSYFDPFAWQIYFYMGVILSHLKFDKGHTFEFSIAIKAFLLTCIAALFIIKHGFPDLMQPYFVGHGSASLVYQANLLLAAYLVMLLMRKCTWFFTLKYPVFLGQHALPVFSFHCVAIYFILPATNPFTTQNWYWDVLACVGFVLLLALPAKLDAIWRNKIRSVKNGTKASSCEIAAHK